MNRTIKLSVSSVLLAGLVSGCSQQQVSGGSQVAGGQQIFGGGQQVAGGQQIAGGGQAAGGQQVAGGQQAAGGQQVLGGQQRSRGVDAQIQSTIVPGGYDTQIQNTIVPETTHMHDAAVQKTEHSHNVEPQQRVYVPLPEAMKEKPAAVFMYDQPEKAEPVYYDDKAAVAEPVYYEQAAQKVRRPAIPRQKPVVRHKGIGMPPAQPGQCFAKVNTPAKFKNAVKRVQISPAVNKRVKVRGPQYTWITKKVLARPATHRNQYIPAQYRNVTKKVLVKPAHYAWQKGKTGAVTRIDHMTGEILCRVKIPAVYRTVTQKVLARPAQRIKRNIPAVYRTIKQKKLASPAVYRTIRTPARFVNKTYRVQTSGPRLQWKPIACKQPQRRAAVQHAQPVVRKHVPARVSAEQRQLAIEFNRQQQMLHQQWLQQEAQRKRQASNPRPQQRQQVAQQRHVQPRQAQPRQIQQRRGQHNQAQIQANQQRRAQHAARERQRLAKLAQQRKLAQQARLREVQIAKQRRMAQHQANLLAQRKAAQMRRLNAPQPSYAKPKVRRPAQVRYTPKPRQHQVKRAQLAPKVRPYQQQRINAAKQRAQVQSVSHTPKQRVQQPRAPKPNRAVQQAAVNDNTPLTRANAVFRIQKALLQRGFNPGPVDGKLGPATVKALTAFQETKGLKTGTLNRDTLRALSLVN